MSMSNRERANRAKPALCSYQDLVGEVDPSFEATVSDLLADIRHFCDDHNLNFDDLEQRALRHYHSES